MKKQITYADLQAVTPARAWYTDRIGGPGAGHALILDLAPGLEIHATDYTGDGVDLWLATDGDVLDHRSLDLSRYESKEDAMAAAVSTIDLWAKTQQAEEAHNG